MLRLRRYLGSLSITPIGSVLLSAFALSCLLGLLGSSSVRAPALTAAGVIALIMLGGLSGGKRGRSTKGLAERRAEFGPVDRNASDDPLPRQAEEELWRKERERYRQTNGSN
jgi:hypothetical protein